MRFLIGRKLPLAANERMSSGGGCVGCVCVCARVFRVIERRRRAHTHTHLQPHHFRHRSLMINRATPRLLLICELEQIRVPSIHQYIARTGWFLFCVLVRGRILPAAERVLPGVGVPRRAALHRLHHAPVHHQRGPLPQPALPHALRTQQDQAKGRAQDHLRLAAIHRHEHAAQPHVLQGEQTNTREPPHSTKESHAKYIKLIPFD